MKRKLASLLSSLLVLLSPCALAAEETAVYSLPEQGITITLPAGLWMDTRDELLTEYGLDGVADNALFMAYDAAGNWSVQATIEPMDDNAITGAASGIDEQTAAVLELFGLGNLAMPASFQAMSDQELTDLAASYNTLMGIAAELIAAGAEGEEMALLMALLGEDCFDTYSCKNGKYLCFGTTVQSSTVVEDAEVSASGQVLCYLTVENGRTYTYIFSTSAPGEAFTAQARAIIDTISYSAPVEPLRYEDTAAHWARHDIGRAVRQGLFTVEGTRFDPDAPATRALLVTALYRAAGSPEAGQCPFPDVSAGAEYASAAAWAYESGIIQGDGGRFLAQSSLTREQLAAIFQRYTAWRGADVSLQADDFWAEYGASYPDHDKISSWASQSMAWAAENALLSGDEEGNLSPQGITTRAQLACVLMRYLDREAEGYFAVKAEG